MEADKTAEASGNFRQHPLLYQTAAGFFVFLEQPLRQLRR